MKNLHQPKDEICNKLLYLNECVIASDDIIIYSKNNFKALPFLFP